ncbi:hypothetical protein ACQKKO_10365 [Alkalihalobacillus sp. NPDC127517]
MMRLHLTNNRMIKRENRVTLEEDSFGFFVVLQDIKVFITTII